MLSDGKIIYGYELKGEWLECGDKLKWLKSFFYLALKDPRFKDELKQYLDQHGIQTNIHYATTTHLQPAYRKWYTPCPVAERTVNEILSLPCYYSLTEEECKYISNTVRRFFQ